MQYALIIERTRALTGSQGGLSLPQVGTSGMSPVWRDDWQVHQLMVRQRIMRARLSIRSSSDFHTSASLAQVIALKPGSLPSPRTQRGVVQCV
jgi:hypothetical protein